ncbi:hypothetical protein F66182_8897 [Fusarium sp. NRRL 66182]|nr:hypothetical protein F66182_8897 [Fusarium sp. NRRL 66182]
MEDVTNNVSFARRATETLPDIDLRQTDPLMALAKQLSDKYNITGDAKDIEAAIQATRQAVVATPDDDFVLHASRLLYLSYLHKDRSLKLSKIDDLNTAIELAEKAVEELADSHPGLILALRALRARLVDKFAMTGTDLDLERAIHATKQSMEASVDGHWDQWIQFGDMSSLLGRRYLATGALEDLEEAISMGWRALRMTKEEDVSSRAGCMQDIADLLRQRSLRTGSLDDLERGIRMTREAIEMDHGDDSTLGVGLNSLGSLLTSRYDITGALIDLDEAISLTKRSLNLPIYNSTMLATTLGNLAVQLQKRYQRSQTLSDLEESTRLSRKAIGAMPDHHPDRARHQHDLGIKLARKYMATNNMADIDDGIDSLRLAIKTAPDNHPNRAIYLHSLANLLLQRASASPSTSGITQVSEWISVTEEAIDATPESHPDRGELFYTLGVGLLAAHAARVTSTGIEEAIPCFEAAIKQENAPTLCRIQACMSLLPICPDPKQSLAAAQLVMGLIPRVIPRQQDHSDRQSSLAELAGLASDAAAVAIQAGRVDLALELLEQGQGLLGASTEQMQTDIMELHKSYPQHAVDFERLRNEINRPLTTDPSVSQSQALREGQALRLYDAGKEFDELVDTIRRLPNLETFLQAPGIDAMLSIADRGPVIIVNVSIICCDAIVILPGMIRSIPLVDLQPAEIEQKVLFGDRGSPDVLEWLWDTIVAPIFQVLGFVESPVGSDWPHVWWIATGFLRQFPLHAAGYHRKQMGQATLDRVVSSYASSVKALLQGRQRRSPGALAAKAVLVAMEKTPTLSNLAFAEREVEAVKRLCLSMGLQTTQPERLKTDLVEQLRGCRFFHFAGHGCTDPNDPLKSYLCLEDVTTNPLRVADLLDLNLKEQPPFLAYLSACGTGRIQEERFMDESVHLISACQLAGFRHVIGTLWEVNDEVCVEMAKVIYESIRDGQMTDQSVSWGVHKACRQSRDSWVDGLDHGGNQRGTSDAPKNKSKRLGAHKKHGYRWAKRRIRSKAKAAGGIALFGTKWGKLSMKPSLTSREKALLRRRKINGYRDSGLNRAMFREASLLLLKKDKVIAAPTWVPFVHYGI